MKCFILLQISLEISNGLFRNIPALVQILVWHLTGDRLYLNQWWLCLLTSVRWWIGRAIIVYVNQMGQDNPGERCVCIYDRIILNSREAHQVRWVCWFVSLMFKSKSLHVLPRRLLRSCCLIFTLLVKSIWGIKPIYKCFRVINNHVQ